MDKLNKILKGLWRYKERMVLVVMLCFLGYRVYELFNPQPAETAAAAVGGEPELPQIPPNDPPPDAPGQYYNMLHRSPFSYYSDAPVDDRNALPPEIKLELLAIRQVSGKWRAQIRTETAKKWYDEGENFEEFVLESINPDENSAVVYVTRIARSVTVRIR